ncbi:MAG: glycosyltransferase family 4 protein [Oscillospiraceae bacterium]|jgi:glycosyltransferase involved in cell wall biosynthesis|nr:glycosyltransferase family 4 protein [Oscillospiraceae bacterium]
MRVLMINHFPIEGSGSGTYTRNIAVHLMKKGHEVCIVMPENTAHFSSIPGAEIYPVFFTYDEPLRDALPFNFPCFTTHPRSTKTFFDLDDAQLEIYLSAFERAIEKAVAAFRPDVIHAQHVWLLSWLAKKTGIPYVITAHGTDLMGYQKSSRFRHYADEAVSGAKKIVTISNDNDALVRELFPGSAGKTVFMRNGYDPERFYPERLAQEQLLPAFDINPLKRLVLFTGKLTYFKGIDVLLEAARLYEGEHSGEIVTIIAGEGELSCQLKKQAKDYMLKNVHFLGFLDISDLRKLYSTADVSIVPSRREPFGLVAIEALACGCPVVATNQGGLPDIINSDVGSLVDVDDAIGLSSAILRELYRPDIAQRRENAAKYALETYAQNSIIDELVEIFNS